MAYILAIPRLSLSFIFIPKLAGKWMAFDLAGSRFCIRAYKDGFDTSRETPYREYTYLILSDGLNGLDRIAPGSVQVSRTHEIDEVPPIPRSFPTINSLRGEPYLPVPYLCFYVGN
jgi:hypothetical protein